MFTEPTEEHRWLQQMIGKWTFESACQGGPGCEPSVSRGVERVRAFGDLWVIGDGQGEMPGEATMSFITTLGFDPARGRYLGTWIATAMGSMFVYDGTREGDVLTLDTEGPAFTDPTNTARYQDIIELIDADHRRLTSRYLDDAGSWHAFMQGEYTRVK